MQDVGNIDNKASSEVDKDLESKETVKEDTVKYESFKKLLDQHKNLTEKLKSYEDKEKELEMKKLEDQGRFQEIIKEKENQLSTYKDKYINLNKQILNAKKMDAVLTKLGGDLKHKDYQKFIDIDSIVIDETGNIDSNEVELVASKFIKEHSHLVEFKNSNAKLPHDNKMGASSTLQDELKSCKSQAEFEKILKKHGKM